MMQRVQRMPAGRPAANRSGVRQVDLFSAQSGSVSVHSSQHRAAQRRRAPVQRARDVRVAAGGATLPRWDEVYAYLKGKARAGVQGRQGEGKASRPRSRALSSCMPCSIPHTAHACVQGLRSVSPEDAKEMMDSGDWVIVDVRPQVCSLRGELQGHGAMLVAWDCGAAQH